MSSRRSVSLYWARVGSRVSGRTRRPGNGGGEVTRYLISFDQGAMDHIPDEDAPAVGEAALAVSKQAMDAGVFVFAGGFTEEVSVVATDGTVTDAPKSKPHIGGGMIVDVPSREGALEWAARIAVACRCAQELHEIMPDPAVGN
jgi:hypothetical protein